MLRRLRTLTRAHLTPDDVEGRVRLRPFPAFYFNDKKKTTALAARRREIEDSQKFPTIIRIFQ